MLSTGKRKWKCLNVKVKRRKAVGRRLDDKIRFQQKEGQHRSELEKASKTVRCTFWNGSVLCTERKYMRRNKGTFEIFFGIEHRMRKEDMEEHFNKEAKQGWIYAADTARITVENAGSEDP